MKIAIVGTRGIPNRYGGFEQFAEYLSVGLVDRGHDVVVYNPHFHEYSEPTFHGVEIVRRYLPEHRIGAAANILYDYLSLKDALARGCDIIYEAGYGTSALSLYVCDISRSIIVTNMDGMEWQRSKWSKPVKRLMRWFEKLAARRSHYLVADNAGIQHYLESTYGRDAALIAYGANVFDEPDAGILGTYDVEAREYFLLIARMEPENNIEMILDGYVASGSDVDFLVIGGTESRYGRTLRTRYANHPGIRFLGGIYEAGHLDNLRHFCRQYFHGHSVGGTNPSLLEAMAAGAPIAAHDNHFNRAVLQENAFYFNEVEGVVELLRDLDRSESSRRRFIERNLAEIRNVYHWDRVVDQYERYFESLLRNCASRNRETRAT